MNMVLLVGEQPAPNLLPLRHYNPDQVALVQTTLPIIQERAKRLAAVIGNRVQQPLCQTDAYKVANIQRTLETYIREHGWAGSDLIFNLTGGTKTMALATYEIARQMGAAAFYYQTEDNQSLIHPYHFEHGKLVVDEPVLIEETLTLDQYLKLYAGTYTLNTKPKDRFEEMVYQALDASGLPNFEAMPSVYLSGLGGDVEVDMLVRIGNQVAAFEVKQTASKKGIDQLNGVTDQRTLGTYTRKILVSAEPLKYNHVQLTKAHRIQVVVLESGKSGQLSEADKEKLVNEVKNCLTPKPRKP
jgi:hypothetical protein